MTNIVSRTLLHAAVITGLLACVAAPAHAQSAAERAAARRQPMGLKAPAPGDARNKKDVVAEAPRFPDATRANPEALGSAKLGPQMKALFDAYEKDDGAGVIALADPLIANPAANAYEHALAARLAGATLVNSDPKRALAYLQQAVTFDGLGNNEHFETMFLIAQLQLQEGEYAQSLASVDAFLAATASKDPKYLAFKGNALYQLKRYPEAAAALKQAVDAVPEPSAEWLQLLMGTYAEMGQPAEAQKLAEALVAKDPDDKTKQMNLAAVYMQNDQGDKATALLEKLRASGALTEERDYRNLYALYSNAQGKEAQVIAVINDGLAKNILKPSAETYTALAQAYYFSEQPKLAIEAYEKAVPLATNGESALNLARVLQQENQLGAARKAAQTALDKGVKKPEDARKILALPGK